MPHLYDVIGCTYNMIQCDITIQVQSIQIKSANSVNRNKIRVLCTTYMNKQTTNRCVYIKYKAYARSLIHIGSCKHYWA